MTTKGYGIDINTIEKLITKPDSEIILSRKEFELRKLALVDGEDYSLKVSDRDSTIYTEDSFVYILSGPKVLSRPATCEVSHTTADVREKYWGKIETIVSKDYAGKRIFCEAGKHSSLEYHCKKTEGYYIHSGALVVRVRAGRAEDKLFELTAGQAMFIPPGLMHQRGSRVGAVVIEISTSDDDSDSFLVEDGQKSPMPNLPPL